eukprot:10243413-Heterocapsa_arctica.AAC.1
MEDFLSSCVDRYLELAGPGTKMTIVATPFLIKHMNQSLVRKPLHPGSAITCLGASVLSRPNLRLTAP